MQVTYKIIQTINGTMVATEPRDIYAWAMALGRKTSYIPDRMARYLRSELRNQPRIEGLCGPMYDGIDGSGKPVVRYEDQASNNALSI
jgi:hypothetical protein